MDPSCHVILTARVFSPNTRSWTQKIPQMPKSESRPKSGATTSKSWVSLCCYLSLSLSLFLSVSLSLSHLCIYNAYLYIYMHYIGVCMYNCYIHMYVYIYVYIYIYRIYRIYPSFHLEGSLENEQFEAYAFA